MEAEAGQGGPPSPSRYFAMTRKSFFKATIASGLLLNILFLANMSYIFGSLFQSPTKTHALNVLLVDYDGGVVSQSVRAAYSSLKSNTFVTIQEQPASNFDGTAAIDDAVCSGDYWAALYVAPNASSNLAQALEGGSAAESYNASSALGLVWYGFTSYSISSSNTLLYVGVEDGTGFLSNQEHLLTDKINRNEVHYPVISQGYVYSALQTLLGATSSVYYSINGTQALSTMNQSDPAARAALFRPISSTAKNLTPVGTG